MDNQQLSYYAKTNGVTSINTIWLEDIQEISNISSKTFEVNQETYDRLIKKNAKGNLKNGKFFITSYIAKIKYSNEEKIFFASYFKELEQIRKHFKSEYSQKLINQASNLIDKFQAKKVTINFN